MDQNPLSLGHPLSLSRKRSHTYGQSNITHPSENTQIKSQIFKGGSKNNYSWGLKMKPRKKVGGAEHFVVYLKIQKFGNGDSSIRQKQRVFFQISFLDANGKPGVQQASAWKSVDDGLICYYKDKIILNGIISPANPLVQNDTLKIHCRIWIQGDVKHMSGLGGAAIQVSDQVLQKRRQELLTRGIGGLLTDPTFCDVVISTNTKTFQGHKAVLAARSPVFKAMLSTGMLESAQSSIEIKDFDEDIVNAMMEYIYTGETSVLKSYNAPDLFRIADKYDVSGLKEDCEHAIGAGLTVDNCGEILVLAHLHNATRLKPNVYKFIERNKREALGNHSFQQVVKSNPTAFVDIFLAQ